MRPLLERARDNLRDKEVVAVMSGKGGVGKSTVATLLAFLHKDTALIDLDIFGMSIPRLFGVVGRLHEVEKEGIKPFEIGGVKLFSLGGVVGDRYVVLPGANEGGVVEALLAFADLDGVKRVVIDMPPGMGEALLALERVAKFKPVLVSTPSKMSIKVVGHLADYLSERGVKPPLFVLNMAYVECGGVKVYPFGRGEEARQLAERLGSTIVELPIDPDFENYVGKIHEYRGPIYRELQKVRL